MTTLPSTAVPADSALSTPPPTAMRYVPALDGLRAAAVLVVMTYHGGVVQTPGGFLGVDLFFVLSGFLITSLLVIEHQHSGAINLKGFWIRRAKRLLPALLVVLGWIALYSTFWADPLQRTSLRGDSFSTLFYVANWHLIAADQSYFEQFLTPSPLRHMWSLGIEEQWYLVWPLVFIGLATFVGLGRRVLPLLIMVGAVASAVLMAVLVATDPSRVYYGTDTRAQGLLLGAGGAIFVQQRSRSWTARSRTACTSLAIAGGVVLVVMIGWVDDTERWMYRGGFFLAALAALALVVGAWLPGPPTHLQRVLGIRPLAAIGVISYGLYLWHWPIYIFMTPTRTQLDGDALLIARMAVTFVAAIASFELIERPIRTGTGASGRRLKRTSAAVAVAGILLAAVIATAAPVGAAMGR